MRKIFFIVLVLCNLCFAHSVDIYTKPIEIKTSLSSYNLDDFNKIKDKLDYFEVKLFINKEHFLHKNYYLQIFCDIGNLIKINSDFIYDKKSIMIKITKENIKDLHLVFKYNKSQKIHFDTLHISEFEYKYLHDYKQLIFGIALGIVFCAILYNLIIYFNTFHKASLYYTGMQFFLFLLLFNTQIYLSDRYIISIEMILDLTSAMTIIFIVLFSYEVLNLKYSNYYIKSFYKSIILLHIIDIILILILKETLIYEYISKFYLPSIILLLNIFLGLKNPKETLLYSLGWISIILTLIFVKHELVDLHENIVLSIGLPLESLFLSFALGLRLKKIIKDKESLLIQQNKLASMGEMINNIAHQWKQPLTNLSFINMDLQLAIRNNETNRAYLDQVTNDSNQQIEFMSKTLDDFKGFYLPNKQKESFYIHKSVKKAVDIIKPSLDESSIKINIQIDNDFQINSYENEFIQVILNILNNAKEALIERNISNPTINILVLKNKNSKTIIEIQDNAKGIKKEIIDKIFNPYFSTKYKNSGIGLYMSKVIMDSHIKGNINVKNQKMGVCFQIIIQNKMDILWTLFFYKLLQ